MIQYFLSIFGNPWHAAVAAAVLASSTAGMLQAKQIWQNRSAADVNLASWFIWWTSVLILMAYAWENVHDTFVRVSYALSFIANTSVIAGILRARRYAAEESGSAFEV